MYLHPPAAAAAAAAAAGRDVVERRQEDASDDSSSIDSPIATMTMTTASSSSSASSSASAVSSSSASSTSSSSSSSSSSISSVSPSATAGSATTTEPGATGQDTGIIIGLVVAVSLLILLSLGFYYCRRARLKSKDPKYIPSQRLKNAWLRWNPRSRHDRLSATDDQESATTRPATASRANMSRTHPTEMNQTTASTTSDGPARNTSIRSIMTLPAYNASASTSEQVLGREGERAGIDVVIEFPETSGEDEQRREEEMEALYQVRLARRRENEERDERRRLRREAREQGDFVALRELQNAPRGNINPGGRTIEELRAEHDRIKRERARAVSSVSYADLGVARHDGSRLRSNSDENDTESQGLLGDAASFATSMAQRHRRDRSSSSTISLDTTDLPAGHRLRNSQAGTPLRTVATNVSNNSSSTTSSSSRAGSSPEILNHHDAEETVPLNSPPGYENISLDDGDGEGEEDDDPPDYTSPLQSRVNSVRESLRQSANSLRQDSLRQGSLRQGSLRSAASTEMLSRTGMTPLAGTSSNGPSRQGSVVSAVGNAPSTMSTTTTSTTTTSPTALPHRLPSLRFAGLPDMQNLEAASPLTEDVEGEGESSDEDLGPRRTVRGGHPEE